MIVDRNRNAVSGAARDLDLDDETLGRAVVNVTRRHEIRSLWEQTGLRSIECWLRVE